MVRKRSTELAVGALVFVAAFGVGLFARAVIVPSGDTAYAQADPAERGNKLGWANQGKTQPGPSPRAHMKPERLGGRDVASVMVNGVPIIRLRSSFRGMSAVTRAQIVLDRLMPLLNAGLRPGEVRAVRVSGSYGVRARDVNLVTVMPLDARLVGSTPSGLASSWAANLRRALRTEVDEPGLIEGVHHPVSSRASGVGPDWPRTPVEGWNPPEPYDDKWVPILSFLQGFKLGMARVNGPTSRLQHVQAVAQLETQWKEIVEIDIFVPISTEVPGKTLDRVEGCAVTGFVDYDF